MKKYSPAILLLAVALSAVFSTTAQAGPPFLTDDPEPVEYQHGEFYVFSTVAATQGATTVQAPAFEFNYGIAEETQFHIIAPFESFASTGNPTEYDRLAKAFDKYLEGYEPEDLNHLFDLYKVWRDENKVGFNRVDLGKLLAWLKEHGEKAK